MSTLSLLNGEVSIMSLHDLRRSNSSSEVAEVEGRHLFTQPRCAMISEGLDGPGVPRVSADSQRGLQG